ncbi:Uncharacterised protein [Klebsiella pneumoniae]|uniref:Uncharacterized protein n=1 Tax=Klebsiella pneumoniae TaxID=573 RepID=A0A8B4U6D6_KLEPN|nr:hypothetical protein AI2626V1_3304 [Klebsiella pneumoniae]CAH4956837.1 hypothetical protein AI2626V1_3304 [Klebsiella pneumoniae]SBW56196.1 Uncharacterised protein [Klebsiella pneumoniae]SSM00352.1 Uncharacterised protein [Klebsiella pneumoniae]SWA64580.1 Uncharacterised protein [Klebsiella pneumoniae]
MVTDTITQTKMMHTSDTLNFPIKLYARRIRIRGGFQVCSCSQFGKHLPTDAPLLRSGRYPSWLVSRPVRVALHPDIFLLAAAQLLRQLTHHALTCGRLQTRQERI